MSEETKVSAPADGPEAEANPGDALGDAGKRALAALRAEVKELRAQLKEQASESEENGTGDPAGSGDSTSMERDAPSAETEGEHDAAESVGEPQPPRFQGGADGGTRAPIKSGQITGAELRQMTPREIEKARREGRLRDLLTGNSIR